MSNPYVEGGSESIKSLSRKLRQQLDRTGLQQFYGWVCRPEDHGGKLFKDLTTEERKTWVQSHAKTPNIPFSLAKKGCYGWVWEHIKSAVKMADKCNGTNLFAEINISRIASYPLSLAKALKLQKWKVVYFASDISAISNAEREQVTKRNAYSLEVQLLIDIKMVNFSPQPGSSSVKDTRGLEKLKTIGFYWIIVDNGGHSVAASGTKVSEFHWEKCPNQYPITEPLVEQFLKNWVSGIIILPPGTSTSPVLN